MAIDIYKPKQKEGLVTEKTKKLSLAKEGSQAEHDVLDNVDQNGNKEEHAEKKKISLEKSEQPVKPKSNERELTYEEEKDLARLHAKIVEQRDLAPKNAESLEALVLQRWSDPATLSKTKKWFGRTYSGEVRGENEPVNRKKHRDRLRVLEHVRNMVRRRKEILEKMLQSELTVNAGEVGAQPHNLGGARYMKTFGVFKDAATEDGTPLTDLQKEIIRMHELGHAIRDFKDDGFEEFSQKEVRLIQSVLDKESLEETLMSKQGDLSLLSYIMDPQEIIERLAQIANYFGLKAGEKLTVEHFKYAQKNYVKDTGLDNRMTEFLTALNLKNAVDVANSYPL